MRKIVYLVIMFIAIFSVQINVYAADTCSNEEMARLKELAEKIEFTYDYEWVEFRYDEENDIMYRYPNFTITAKKLSEELNVIVQKDKEFFEFEDNGDGIGHLNGFLTGDKLVIIIRANVENGCMDKNVVTKNIAIPILNGHYYKAICQDNLDFKYCQQFMDEEITDEQFDVAFDKWKNGNKDINNTNKTVNNPSNFLIIMIVSCVVLIVIIVVLIAMVKINRRNSFEVK